ncbi:MAG: glycosyltransferase family 2 protein, partial [Thermoanaerobaculia bacterium]
MTYFSVVIPTYNRLDMLLRVLDALQKQIDAPELETIVINDGSTDSTDATLRERRDITYREQANAGPGRARNHGVSLAKGRYVIFIGDDTVPEPRFL